MELLLRNLKSVLEQGADQRGDWWRNCLGIAHTSLRPGHPAYETVKRGSVVTRVVEGSPAAAPGLQAADVVTGVNGQPVRGYADLTHVLVGVAPGERVRLTIARNGRAREVELPLGPRPQG
ncbi:MAG: PDZ domain-containing protein [Bacillota bacterium]